MLPFSVLTFYLLADFQGGEKPKGGGTLENRNFFVEGGKGLAMAKWAVGGQEPSKTPLPTPHFLYP